MFPASAPSCYSLSDMPYSERWVRQLLRGLRRKEPEDLLCSRSYADPTFLGPFFDWLDDLIFNDPKAALKWARIAPELALKARREDGARGRRDHRERLIEAWVVRGSALRSCGDYRASHESYREARKLARVKYVSDSLKADVKRRLSTLKACQGKNDDALELATGAVKTLRKLARKATTAAVKAAAELRKVTGGSEAAKAEAAEAVANTDEALVAANLQLGQGLVSLGYVLASGLRRHGEAIDAFGEAITLAGDAKRSKAIERLHTSACNNLAMAIIESPFPRDQSKAMLFVEQARELVKGQWRSQARYRVLWVEGLIWSKMGCHARAAKLMKMALEGFQALKLPWEIALVGLDLAALRHVCGEWDKLEELAADTYGRFRLLAADTKAIAALSLWNDAVKARKGKELLEKFEQARKVIVAGVTSGRSCKKKR